jgi:hypothetical protein
MSPIAVESQQEAAIGDLKRLLKCAEAQLKSAWRRLDDIPRRVDAKPNPNGEAYACAAPQEIPRYVPDWEPDQDAPALFTADQVRALRHEDVELIDGLRREVASRGEESLAEIHRLHGEIRKARQYAETLELRLEQVRNSPDLLQALRCVIRALHNGGVLASRLEGQGSALNFLRQILGEQSNDLSHDLSYDRE